MGGGCCVGNCCVVDCGFCCVFDMSSSSGGCGYHPIEVKTESHADKVANELADMKKKISKSVTSDEEALITSLNWDIDHFVDTLRTINEADFCGKKLNINIDNIVRKNDELKKNVVGFIGRRLDDRLVLTDKELSIILKEENDKKRARNFDDFVIEVRKKAVEDLIQTIQRTIEAQSEVIETEIQSRLKEVNMSLKEEVAEYEKLDKMKKEKDLELGKKQLEYMFEYSVCDRMLKEIKHDQQKI